MPTFSFSGNNALAEAIIISCEEFAHVISSGPKSSLYCWRRNNIINTRMCSLHAVKQLFCAFSVMPFPAFNFGFFLTSALSFMSFFHAPFDCFFFCIFSNFPRCSFTFCQHRWCCTKYSSISYRLLFSNVPLPCAGNVANCSFSFFSSPHCS